LVTRLSNSSSIFCLSSRRRHTRSKCDWSSDVCSSDLAFLALFIIFTVLLGLPLLLAEFTIGRSGGGDALSAFKKLAPRTPWYGIGILGMITCFILLSFYSVIGGWIIFYLYKLVTGELSCIQTAGYDQLFETTIANTPLSLGVQFI